MAPSGNHKRAPVWGVFGGSFNPPHIGHLLLTQYLLGLGQVDRILVLPCFDHAFGKELCAFELRCHWLREMFKDDPRVEVCGIEGSLSQDLGHAPRSLEVLDALALRHPHATLRWIVGQDIIDSGETVNWYRWEELARRYCPIVVPRSSAGRPGPLPWISSSSLRASWQDPSKAAWLTQHLPASVARTRKAYPGPWPVRAPLGTPRGCWVIGQGQAGRSMQAWLEGQGVVTFGISARALQAKGASCLPSEVCAPQLIWLATRPDQCAGLVQKLLPRINARTQEIYLCSSSGAYSAEHLQLDSFQCEGISVGTLHPIIGLTGRPEPLDSAYFAWSGQTRLGAFLTGWLGDARLIDLGKLSQRERLGYHAACALVSNYWGGVWATSRQKLGSLGLDEQQGGQALFELMRASLVNLAKQGIPAGVSGVLARGEERQLAQHHAQWDKQGAALHAALVEALRKALRQ